uniref:Metalloendopeptidase n=1 Tax=Pachycerianthus borealis TaxID=2736680 RepID=A0A7G7WYP4_9CNID|nr:toxin candidate TRINITY_DN22746_c0_g1_i1 [Pachycerianthus borealis]
MNFIALSFSLIQLLICFGNTQTDASTLFGIELNDDENSGSGSGKEPLGEIIEEKVDRAMENLEDIGEDEKVKEEDPINKANEVIEAKNKVFEGDIILTKADREEVDLTKTGDIDGRNVSELATRRNAIRGRQSLWQTKVVPVEILTETEEGVGKQVKDLIVEAVKDFHRYTCIRFRDRISSDKNWIKFVSKQGCYSNLGRQFSREGPQEISIGRGCELKGIVMHEIMHSLGFWHEQSRWDRNQYVQINWENVQDGKNHNFNKYFQDDMDFVGAMYDYTSLMHYRNTELSKNGKPTIELIKDPSQPIGQRQGFSQTDVLQLNALYDCDGPKGGWSSWTEFGPCNLQCTKFQQRFCTSENRNRCPGVTETGLQTRGATCSDDECYAPIEGGWGRWSSWSACTSTKSCESGYRTCNRLCNNPSPAYGGDFCEGAVMLAQSCSIKCSGGSKRGTTKLHKHIIKRKRQRVKKLHKTSSHS